MSIHRTVLVLAHADEGDTRYEHQLQQDKSVTYRVLKEQFNTPLEPLFQSGSQIHPIDGILLAFPSSYVDSFNLLRQLKQQIGEYGPPIVVIDNGDAEIAVQAFKHGAVDYLIRDRMTPEDLRVAMRSAIANAELQRKLQHSQERFQTSVENMLDCFGIFSAIRNSSGQIIDFRIDYLNAAACENNQMPKEMQIGQGLCEVLPAHRESGLFDEYCRLVETGEPLIKDSLIYDDTYGEQRLIRAFDIRATRLNDGFVASWRDVTDRKQLELRLSQTITALQQQQQRLAEIEAIYQSAPIGLAVLDADLRFVRINQRLAEINGFSIEAHIGRTVQDLLPDLVETIEQLLRPLWELGEPLLNVEIQGETPAQPGIKRTWLEHFLPLKEGDRVIGISLVCEEITERSQVEATLRQSEERFRNMADNAPMMVWMVDATGYCTYLNRRWYEFTGQTEATGLGFGWLDAVHPEDHEFSRDIFLRANERHEAFQLEYRLRHKDGDYRLAIDAASPWFGENGDFKGYIGSVIDISDRQQLEASLRDSQTQLQRQLAEIEAIYQSAPIGLTVLDTNLRFVRINQRLAEMNGFSVEDHLGRTVQELLPDLADTTEQLLHPILATGEPLLNVEIHGETPAQPGVKRIWLEHFLPLKEGDRVVGISLVCEEITERKRIEAEHKQQAIELQTALQKLNSHVENSPLAVIEWDHNFRVSRWSQAAERIFGWQAQEVLGKGINEFNLVLAADYEQVLGVVTQLCKGNEQIISHNRNCTKTGSIIHCEWYNSALLDNTGQMNSVLSLVLDVTERKQVEEALHQSEDRLRMAIESAQLGTWDWNLITNQLRWDVGCKAMFGLPPDAEISVEVFLAGVHPHDRDRLQEVMRWSCDPDSGGNYDVDYRTIGIQDGIERWVTAKGQAYFDAAGTPLRFIGTVMDITERKQAEANLRQSEERYRALFESMNEGFCVVEMVFDEHNKPLDYRFLETNPQFEHQTGLRQAEGKTARQLLPTLEEHWFEIYGQIALTGEPHRFENGSDIMQRWFDVSAFRIGLPEHRKVAILFKEISDRKLAEQERERLLVQEQAARAEAERANRIKDEFLAVLSHELRSPLNPILGWTKLLQTRKFDAAKTTEALAIIERNAKLQTQLIDDLLDVAKILRGKLSLTTTAVDLLTVIDAAIDTVQTAAIARSIDLRLTICDFEVKESTSSSFQLQNPKFQVSGDAARLQQIIWNLLSNAIKFTPEGGQVEVQLTRHEVSGANEELANLTTQTSNPKPQIFPSYAQITVIDTGKGINPDFLPHIFESFRQEDASTTRKYGGLGLGLAIVRQLVEAHGGTITANSAGEGMGSTFTIRLPLLNQTPRETEKSQAVDAAFPSLQVGTPALPLTGLQILIVDDEADARDLLTVLLTQYGAEVITVTTAADVLTALESSQPDVLISDIGMPMVDGYTLIQQIRALPADRGGQVPAIALTAYARAEDAQRAIASGYQQHVTKPLEPETLIQAVVAIVKSSPGHPKALPL